MLIRPAGEAVAGDVVLHVLVMQEMDAVHHADDAPRGGFRLFAAHDHHWYTSRSCQQVKRLVMRGAVVVVLQEAKIHLVFLFPHVFPFLSLRQAAGNELVIEVAVFISQNCVHSGWGSLWQVKYIFSYKGKFWNYI